MARIPTTRISLNLITIKCSRLLERKMRAKVSSYLNNLWQVWWKSNKLLDPSAKVMLQSISKIFEFKNFSRLMTHRLNKRYWWCPFQMSQHPKYTHSSILWMTTIVKDSLMIKPLKMNQQVSDHHWFPLLSRSCQASSLTQSLHWIRCQAHQTSNKK